VLGLLAQHVVPRDPARVERLAGDPEPLLHVAPQVGEHADALGVADRGDVVQARLHGHVDLAARSISRAASARRAEAWYPYQSRPPAKTDHIAVKFPSHVRSAPNTCVLRAIVLPADPQTFGACSGR